MKKHNFGPGPSILPQEVFQKSSEAIIEFENTELSILEISHRDKQIIAMAERARSLSLKLLGLQNKGYQALFLQGGASTQFLMVAYNLLKKKGVYIDSGSWSSKAIKEAKFIGDVEVIASSKDKNYNYIPKQYTVPKDADYLHITTNNTIFGTQFNSIPEVNIPLIADMSSDIFAKNIDYSKFSLIYAGAQKNIGSAGTTLVIVKEDMLGEISRKIPSMLNYQTHIKQGGMFNTPPVFAIYVSMLTLEWIENKGGLTVIESENKKKANMLYYEIERNSLFNDFVEKEDRSIMNVTFTLKDESLKDRFDEFWKSKNIYGLGGHRSVGGYRASIYNAMPYESVALLVETMQEFEKSAV